MVLWLSRCGSLIYIAYCQWLTLVAVRSICGACARSVNFEEFDRKLQSACALDMRRHRHCFAGGLLVSELFMSPSGPARGTWRLRIMFYGDMFLRPYGMPQQTTMNGELMSVLELCNTSEAPHNMCFACICRALPFVRGYYTVGSTQAARRASRPSRARRCRPR